MSHIWEGDNWKHAKEPPPTATSTTREKAQSEANADYAMGRISIDEWRKITNCLSEPLREIP